MNQANRNRTPPGALHRVRQDAFVNRITGCASAGTERNSERLPWPRPRETFCSSKYVCQSDRSAVKRRQSHAHRFFLSGCCVSFALQTFHSCFLCWCSLSLSPDLSCCPASCSPPVDRNDTHGHITYYVRRTANYVCRQRNCPGPISWPAKSFLPARILMLHKIIKSD